MDMSFMFWIVTVTMAVIALSFLVLPMVAKKKKMTSTAWAAVAILPAVAIGLYLSIGRPDVADNPTAHAGNAPAQSATASTASANLGSVGSMLSGLEEKLREDPSDAKGWLLLAKSYSHLGRTEDAAAAYAKASALGQVDAEFEAKLAGNKIVAEAPTIRGRLTISDEAKDRLDPNDSVFIFAKSTDGAAVPVAVLRKTAADLPLDFELSDKQSMSADAKLSGTTAVTITVRISKTGNAMRGEAGLEIVSEPITVGDDGLVELHLDTTQSANDS